MHRIRRSRQVLSRMRRSRKVLRRMRCSRQVLRRMRCSRKVLRRMRCSRQVLSRMRRSRQVLRRMRRSRKVLSRIRRRRQVLHRMRRRRQVLRRMRRRRQVLSRIRRRRQVLHRIRRRRQVLHRMRRRRQVLRRMRRRRQVLCRIRRSRQVLSWMLRSSEVLNRMLRSRKVLCRMLRSRKVLNRMLRSRKVLCRMRRSREVQSRIRRSRKVQSRIRRSREVLSRMRRRGEVLLSVDAGQPGRGDFAKARRKRSGGDAQGLQSPEEFVHGGGAVVRLFGEAAHDEVFNGGREDRKVRRHMKGRDREVNVFEDDFDRRAPMKGRGTREGLVHEYTQGIKVASRIRLVALSLLRGHIGRRAHQHTGLRHILSEIQNLVVGKGFDEAEVEHLHQVGVAVRIQQHNVGRLQVPMDNAHAVRLAQRARDLLSDIEDSGPGQGVVVREHLSQGTPFEKLKGDIKNAVRGSAIVNDSHRIGVVQFGRHGGFSEEALAQRLADTGTVRGVQNFEGDGAV